MTKAGYVVGSAVAGTIAGAVGASFATGGHPSVKGALATGAVYAVLATIVVATDSITFKPAGALSGPPPSLRWP
jgi:hypothetical protein